jgi:hypothetical protein
MLYAQVKQAEAAQNRNILLSEARAQFVESEQCGSIQLGAHHRLKRARGRDDAEIRSAHSFWTGAGYLRAPAVTTVGPILDSANITIGSCAGDLLR